MKAAYPIHPEVFDRLYTDWSTLVRFQRTRGVLRLMAAVIHNLWMKDDRNPLILPANLSIDDPHVLSELTRYLPDNWTPVIEKDVDGPGALPHQIDQNVSNLGKYSACRRVARTVYLGSAPTAGTSQRGIEDRRIKLGCMVPGESPAIFGDALRRLAATATYLYQDGARYWYDTRPTVTKLADDRAEQLRRDPDRVTQVTHARLRDSLNDPGDFARVHAVPRAEHEVGDDRETRLVVLGIEHPHQREGESPAKEVAANILESRGTGPRLYRNTLVFLAADQSRLQDLGRSRATGDRLEIDPRRAGPPRVIPAPDQASRDTACERPGDRQGEAARDLPVAPDAGPEGPIISAGLGGEPPDGPGRPRSPRRARRLKSNDLLATRLAGSMLAMTIDQIPLWRGDHVKVNQIIDDFAQYLYLRRLRGPQVLLDAVKDGANRLLWRNETFAYAEVFDESSGRLPGAPGRKRQGRADGRVPREAGHRRPPNGRTRQRQRRTENARWRRKRTI